MPPVESQPTKQEENTSCNLMAVMNPCITGIKTEIKDESLCRQLGSRWRSSPPGIGNVDRQ